MRQEKQHLLDTLVGGIAHELNNKLTPVQGFAEILALRAAGEMREQLFLIRQSVQEAARIVRQLLQLSKPETVKLVPVDVGAVVEEALLFLKFQLREARCEAAFQRAAEPVVVLADPGQVKQILVNLVMNAVQAMESTAGAAVAVSVRQAGTTAVITVADNGPGIHPENLGRIFDPFFSTKGPDRGTGLGLSICFSIARQHGGDISVENVFGKGATFTVTMPIFAGSCAPEPEARAGGSPRAGGRRFRVLVADDEVVVRLLLQEMLRSNFLCDVDLASNGSEALELSTRADYDLIVSDVRMPRMSGPEFLRQLIECRPNLAERFVFITGNQGDLALRDEIAHWNVPVLAKPFTQSGLLKVCEPHLV
jgi:CheY-like chemotaxis protein